MQENTGRETRTGNVQKILLLALLGSVLSSGKSVAAAAAVCRFPHAGARRGSLGNILQVLTIRGGASSDNPSDGKNGSRALSEAVGAFASGVREGYQSTSRLPDERDSVQGNSESPMYGRESASDEASNGAHPDAEHNIGALPKGAHNAECEVPVDYKSVDDSRRKSQPESANPRRLQNPASERDGVRNPYSRRELESMQELRAAQDGTNGPAGLEAVVSSAALSAATLIMTQVLAMWWMSIIQRAQARIAARRRFLRPPAGGTSNALEDVIGCDEAKTEVGQILDFLKHPKSYTTHGMRVPRGVLLCGPPGTGKTLLARAVAAEAAVPFLYIGGSEFNHKYAGMGVKMVEEVFRVARRLRRCIIFIDEIDYVGKKRGGGDQSLSLDREATLNQLLAEMDGFIGSDNVVVMASTNRPSVLDEALLRSGRFDLQVHFEPPDIRAREKLFLLYTRHMNVTTFILGDKDIGDGSKDLVLNSSTLAGDGDGQIRSLDAQPSRCLKWIATRFFTAMISALPYRHIRPPIPTEISPGHKLLAKELAGLTPGCVGADIENICNTAQLIAARGNRTAVYLGDFSEATDRITAGIAKILYMPEDERISTAVHETGHALVAWILPLGSTVNKISIIHRGGALGYTQIIPEERYTSTRQHILDEVCIGLAGRAAEEIVMGNIGNGAVSDLRRASEQLFTMITKYGFGSSLGLYSPSRDMMQLSNNGSNAVEEEVQRLLVEQYDRALSIIKSKADHVAPMVQLLLEKEVVHQNEIESIWGPKVRPDISFAYAHVNATFLDLSKLVVVAGKDNQQ